MKHDMTVGKEWKCILLFVLPIMAGNFLQQLYNTVDGIVVGNFVGEAAFSAVGTCGPLTFLFLGFAIGLSVGSSVVVSQYFGAKLERRLSVAVDTALILMTVVGAIMAVIAFILTPWLLRTILNVPETIMPNAVSYFRIYALGLVFQFLYNGCASILRSVGDSKATLYFLIVSAVVNLVLDMLFVIVFKWGVAGAAIATVIAQVACSAVSFIYLRKRFPHVKGEQAFDRSICLLILKLGLPSALQQSIVSVGNLSLQRLVNSFGEVSMAAYAAGNRIDSFMFVPIGGFQAGLSTFAGQNVGAGRIDRVKRGLRDTVIMSVLTTAVLGLILFTLSKPIISFFGLSGDALARGMEQVRFLAFMFIIFTCHMCFCGLLQGSGDVLVQSMSTLLILAIRVALSYLGVHFGILGYAAAWVTTPIGWAAGIFISGGRYFSGAWKNKAVAGKLARGKMQEVSDEL